MIREENVTSLKGQLVYSFNTILDTFCCEVYKPGKGVIVWMHMKTTILHKYSGLVFLNLLTRENVKQMQHYKDPLEPVSAVCHKLSDCMYITCKCVSGTHRLFKNKF